MPLEAVALVYLADRPFERVHDGVVEERLVEVPLRHEVERVLTARCAGDGHADERGVAGSRAAS